MRRRHQARSHHTVSDAVFHRELDRLVKAGLLTDWSVERRGAGTGMRRLFFLSFPDGEIERWYAGTTYAFILGTTIGATLAEGRTA